MKYVFDMIAIHYSNSAYTLLNNVQPGAMLKENVTKTTCWEIIT